jgi:RecG-like helicase
LYWSSPDPLNAVEARYADNGENSGLEEESSAEAYGYRLEYNKQYTQNQLDALKDEGFQTLQQLLRHYPKEFVEYKPWGTEELEPGTLFVTAAKVLSHDGPFQIGKKEARLKIRLAVGNTEAQIAHLNSHIVLEHKLYLVRPLHRRSPREWGPCVWSTFVPSSRSDAV